jgi:hypothetical protein
MPYHLVHLFLISECCFEGTKTYINFISNIVDNIVIENIAVLHKGKKVKFNSIKYLNLFSGNNGAVNYPVIII